MQLVSSLHSCIFSVPYASILTQYLFWQTHEEEDPWEIAVRKNQRRGLWYNLYIVHFAFENILCHILYILCKYLFSVKIPLISKSILTFRCVTAVNIIVYNANPYIFFFRMKYTNIPYLDEEIFQLRLTKNKNRS